jgi:hypothetical protein
VPDTFLANGNPLVRSEEGRRDWPLCFYDPKTLFSREARLGWVEPDLAAMPGV